MTRNTLGEAEYYLKTHEGKTLPKRGHFIIFNFSKFDDPKGIGLTDREGSEIDVKKLKECFEGHLGFKVKVKQDFLRKEVKEKLKKLKEYDFSKHQMFGMAIMTHGDEGGILHTYKATEHMILNEYVDAIKQNKTLAGKPKVIVLSGDLLMFWKVTLLVYGPWSKPKAFLNPIFLNRFYKPISTSLL